MTPITRGIGLMIVGIALMSIMDAMIKHLSGTISAPQILFFRALFGLLPLLFLLQKQGNWSAIKTARPGLHLFRSSLNAITFLTFVLGVREMALANALTLTFASPFFMILFSIMLLGEHIGRHRLTAMIIGFVGVLIVLQPDEGLLKPGALYILTSATLYALSMVIVRKFAAVESALCFSFWSTIGMGTVGCISMVFFWTPLNWTILGWCFAIGLFGGFSNYLRTEAMRIAPPAAISPIEYTALVWAAIFDWMIWHLIPEHATVFGSLIIVSSGIYILWREQLHKKEGKTI